jgi:hypothetical protein
MVTVKCHLILQGGSWETQIVLLVNSNIQLNLKTYIIMDAQEARNLLLPIPKEDFITFAFSNEIDKCCAIGHLQRLSSSDKDDYSFANCADNHSSPFRDLSYGYIKKTYGVHYSIASVNNSDTINGYNESHPKDRVIHLLDDMITAGY